MAKTAKEKFKTKHHIFDDFTNRGIFKLISQGHFKGLIGPVSVGKESNVFSAQTKDGRKLIVKIYRLETCDFKRMYYYIMDDPRFQGLRNRRRQVIFTWCQREFRNLLNAREAGVRVPMPITFLNNILVMEHIGDNGAAPKLKDSHPKNKKEFFNGILNNIKKLYNAGFVHGDLSHFNILNYRENPVFIDLSHTTPIKNPNSKELLERDIVNICNFFGKIGLKTDKEKVLEKILSN